MSDMGQPVIIQGIDLAKPGTDESRVVVKWGRGYYGFDTEADAQAFIDRHTGPIGEPRP